MLPIRLSVLMMLAVLTACGGLQTTAPVEERRDDRPGDERVVPPPVETGKMEEQLPVERTLADQAEVSTASQQPSMQKREQSPSEPVVLAALDEAEGYAAGGNTQKAIASLERGIRIKPRDPWLWHQLGVLKLRAGDWLDAISIAQKSNSLAGDNRQLLMGNWQVIADANEALGNLADAERARRKAESYLQE